MNVQITQNTRTTQDALRHASRCRKALKSGNTADIQSQHLAQDMVLMLDELYRYQKKVIEQLVSRSSKKEKNS